MTFLNVANQYTRECVAIRAEGSIDTAHVVAVLDRVVSECGDPECAHIDSGPESVAAAVADWRQLATVGPCVVDPGSPW